MSILPLPGIMRTRATDVLRRPVAINSSACGIDRNPKVSPVRAVALCADANRRDTLSACDTHSDQADCAESFLEQLVRLAVQEGDRGARGHSQTCVRRRNQKNSYNFSALPSFR